MTEFRFEICWHCKIIFLVKPDQLGDLRLFCGSECALDFALENLDSTDSESNTFDYSDISDDE
jgi:hypothetical protein